MSDWRDRFCGRGAELEELRSAYGAVASGEGPRTVVILGDRGMGKTRLALEFYAQLVRDHDPRGYWPAPSLFRGRNLLVAPDVERDPAVREHFAAFTLGSRPMPFLWWGFRLSDPEDRNAVPTDLATHRRFLSLHLEPFRQRKRLDENRLALAGVGVDAARGGLMKVVEMIPVVGGALGMLIEGADLGRRAARLGIERRELQEVRRTTRLEAVARGGAGALVDETLGELEALFSAEGDASPTPLVLFVDDAQFARPGGDEGVLRLLEGIRATAVERRWPLLLVATHWEREWWNSPVDAEERDFAGLFRPGLEQPPLALGREPDLAELVAAGLPGLPFTDAELLLRRADGNPQLLIEIIERVLRSPAWRDADGALSPAGRRHLETASFDLHNLIRQRLESEATPDEVRRAVAISAVQGVEFSCAMAEAAGEVLHAEAVRQGLADAESRHRYVQGVSEGIAVFIQRAYRDAALALVDGQFGSREEVAAALGAVADRCIEDEGRWQSLATAEQDAVLALRASLGEYSGEREARLRAAGSMLRLVMRALHAEGAAADVPRAAFWARRLAAGLDQGRWAAAELELEPLRWAHGALDRWSGAGVALPLALAVRDRLREMLPAEPDEESVGGLAHVLWKVWEGMRLSARFHEADEASAEAYRLASALHARAPSPETAALLAAALERRAEQQRRAGDHDGEEASLRERLALTRRIADEDPADRVYAASAVLAALTLARWLEERGPSDEALTLLREAYARQSPLLDDSADAGDVRRQATILLEAANAGRRRGDVDEAAATMDSVVTAVRSLFEQEPSQEHRIALCATLANAAETRWARGDAAEALERLAETASLLEAVSPPPDLAHAYRQADLYGEMAAYTQATAHGAAAGRPAPPPETGVALPPAARLLGEVGPGEPLRELLGRARGLLPVHSMMCGPYAVIAGRLAAELEWGARAEGGGAEAAAALEAELRSALEARGASEEVAGWHQGRLLALECIAEGAQRRGELSRAARVYEGALRQALRFVGEVGEGAGALGDLLYWIVYAGHGVLATQGRLDPALVRACAERVLRPASAEEEDETRVLRSPALSLLATLGGDIPDGERRALLTAAIEWFGSYPSPLATLAGYEAEVECGAVAPSLEARCGQLAAFAAELAESSDPAAAVTPLEWRFLQRLQRAWGCGTVG